MKFITIFYCDSLHQEYLHHYTSIINSFNVDYEFINLDDMKPRLGDSHLKIFKALNIKTVPFAFLIEDGLSTILVEGLNDLYKHLQSNFKVF